MPHNNKGKICYIHEDLSNIIDQLAKQTELKKITVTRQLARKIIELEENAARKKNGKEAYRFL